MQADRFDSLVRRIAESASRRGDRRTVFKAVGAGGAALLCGMDGAGAAPRQPGVDFRGSAQATVDPLIEEIAFQLEYDQEKIFRFVSDEIGYEPYAGVLRGAKGTLWSGAGNSADQAVLLKALLDASLIDSKFVIGELADAESERLTASIAQSPYMPASVAAFMDNLTAVVTSDQATPTVDQAQLADVAEFRNQLVASAKTAAATDIERFTALLSDAGVLDSAGAAMLPEFERTNHIWLQVQSGTDLLDLDPTFAQEIGDAFAEASADPVDALEDTFYHWIRTRIHADTRSGDGLTEQSLLDYEIRSADMIGEDFTVIHIEPQALEGIGMAISGALEGTIGYYPVIVLGQESFVADSMLTFGSSGGVFGDVFEEEEGGGPSDGEAIAEYLTVIVRSPGQAEVSARHTIFDRSAGLRQDDVIDFASITPVEISKVGEEDEGFLPVKQIFALAAVSSFVPVQYINRPVPEETSWSYLTGATHGFHTSRQTIDSDSTTFPDRPNVSLMTHVPVPAEMDDGAVGARLEANLLLQGFGSRTATVFESRVAAGVMAQRGEVLTLDPEMVARLYEADLLPGEIQTSAYSAGNVFDAADAAGIDTLVLQSNDAVPASLALPDSSAALVSAHLEQGRVVLIPAGPVELPGVGETTAWWVFDPITGDFYDQLVDGRSGATVLYSPMTEYATKLWAFTKTTKGFLALGACVSAVARAVASMIQQEPGREGAGWNVGGNLGGAAFGCAAYAAGGLA